jgi:ATP adenylyltransferase
MKRLWTPWRLAYLKKNAPSNGGCVFCAKISADDDAAQHILYRGKTCFVTLNLYPYNNGHLMIAPLRHVASLQDLEPDELHELMDLTKQAQRVLDKAYSPQGYNIGINQGQVAGAGIADHLHQHIVPRWGGDTNFLTVIGETRTIPEWIDQTYIQLHDIWKSLD